jgi:polar amino acid transport system permease protein
MITTWLANLPELLDGLVVSLRVTVVALLLGLPLGIVLALLVSAATPLIRGPAVVLVEIGRGPPTLVIIYLAYFGLPLIGLTFPAEVCAIVALAFNTGAYTSEIFRGGMLAVPPGQREAAQALGLTRAYQLRDVELPQAIRVAIPPVVGFSITVFQASSLCFVIAVPELLSRAYNIGTVNFDYLTPLLLAAALYAAVSIPGSRLANRLEQTMGRRVQIPA